MEDLFVIIPGKKTPKKLLNMISSFTSQYSGYKIITSINDCNNFKNKKLLFVLNIGITGFDIDMLNFFNELIAVDDKAFHGSTGAIIAYSETEFGTKRSAQDLVFIGNSLGCDFMGHPLVEATKDMRNFMTWQKTLDIPLEEISLEISSRLGKRFLEYKPQKIENPKITVIYSSPHKYSNTLNLWRMVSDTLGDYNITELQIENGKILDCTGCSYKLCQHYAKKNTCFYGGFMVENVLPAIASSDSIVWLCPNYNDSISANLTATINRLTVLYHKQSFYEKSFFAVVVSGNSGSDSVAKQLIGALNINKGFRLPPYAVLSETANDPKAVLKVKDINNKALTFAKNFNSQFEITR
ncbi:MAG: flavodoxin family protein [Solirubrobacterales bacterium]